MPVTGNQTLSKNEKQRSFTGSSNSGDQIHSGFWPGLSKDSNNVPRAGVSVSAPLFHVLAMFSNWLFSHGDLMLPALLGPCPCRFSAMGKECEPWSQNFQEIHSDGTSLITFPVRSLASHCQGRAKHLISIGLATCLTPGTAVVTSEPYGLKGGEWGRSPDKDCRRGRWSTECTSARTQLGDQSGQVSRQ